MHTRIAAGALIAFMVCGCSSGGGAAPVNEDGGTSPRDGGRNGAGGAASSAGGSSAAGGGRSSGGNSSASTGGAPLFFSPYKDTGINMNWNTNVVSTNVSGAPKPLADDLAANGIDAVTLAFATGECGSESWAGVPGATMAQVNVPLLSKAGIRYIVSTGGAAGIFSCASDGGFKTFVDRWASSGLLGIDFDIEAGQTEMQIQDLVRRIKAAHTAYPTLRFSLTLATLANNDGANTAEPLGSGVQDSLNAYGDNTLATIKNIFGVTGSAATWPAYLTVNLMTMDYGAPGSGVCVVDAGACDMGQSAIQAAYNLHDKSGVPYPAIELTPMIGVNDVTSEKFELEDVTTLTTFARTEKLAGVHYWSYDRDRDCPVGGASSTCNSMGNGYAGTMGYVKAFR